MENRRGKRAISRLGESSRAFVSTLAYDAAAGVRAGLSNGRELEEDEEPGFRAERVVIGTARALADPEVCAELGRAGEAVGESLGRGLARGVTTELGRRATAIATVVAPFIGAAVVAGAIGLAMRAHLRRQ